MLAILAASAPVSDLLVPRADETTSNDLENVRVHNISLHHFVLDSIYISSPPNASLTTKNHAQGPCRKITFINARGSSETGNMGSLTGPALCDALKSRFPSDIACQGVGSPYDADIPSNALPDGTSAAAIAEGARMFNLAYTKCPGTVVVASGYSQGTAVINGAVKGLDEGVKDMIAGVVLFGYTLNKQNGGVMEGFPKDKVKVFCAQGDDVCDGTLVITVSRPSCLSG